MVGKTFDNHSAGFITAINLVDSGNNECPSKKKYSWLQNKTESWHDNSLF
jgi:hypothetical protein